MSVVGSLEGAPREETASGYVRKRLGPRVYGVLLLAAILLFWEISSKPAGS